MRVNIVNRYIVFTRLMYVYMYICIYEYDKTLHT